MAKTKCTPKNCVSIPIGSTVVVHGEEGDLFLGNNRQHRPVCAKTISFWVRKVLCC